MRDESNHNQDIDQFSKIFRQKLENHQMPVDEDCWEKIESRMKTPSKKYSWKMIGTVAAAIILLLLIPFYFFYKIPSVDHQVIQVSQQDIKPVNKETKENITEQEMTNSIPVSTKTGITKTVHPEIKQSSSSQDILITDNQVNTNDIQEEIIQVFDHQNNTQKDTVKPENNSKKWDFFEKESTKLFAKGKNKKDNNWMLAAAVGAGGGNLGFNLNSTDQSYYDHDNSSIISPPGGFPNSNYYNNILSPSDFDDIDYSVPLSFGVMARKNFNQYIGLESGIVYTYLSTNFEKNSGKRYKAKMELHYLGIPVNFVAYLWNNPKWNIYMTAGAMAEKGLQSIYSQDIYENTLNSTVKAKNSIDGIQWSINGSLGVSYKLVQDWSLYVEPRVSHYFANNQPISIRTEHSTIISIGGGIRYEF